MTIIYVVTTGEYSNYRILGLFSTETLARAFIERYGDGDITEWLLDERVDDANRTVYGCSLFMNNGALDRRWTAKEFCAADFSEGRPHAGAFYAVGRSAISQAHADKLAAEFRQAYLRENRER